MVAFRSMVVTCTSGRVFVIEPDVAIRGGLTALINTQDIPVLCYRDAEMFMDFDCDRHPVHGCLLLEAELPGQGGFELLRRLHSGDCAGQYVELVDCRTGAECRRPRGD